jgi:hypothetical protein
MQLIKQAIYDLQIGPSEISFSAEQPDIYNVHFDNRKGEDAKVIVRVPSMYPSIHDALKLAYNAKAPKRSIP